MGLDWITVAGANSSGKGLSTVDTR